MAPVLYTLGLFKSYESYAPFIRNVLQHLPINASNPCILVAGVASEKSASALCDAISSPHLAPEIHFFDRCSTPLCRIDNARRFQRCRFKTHVLDILNSSYTTLNAHHEVVIADSFLRQFPSGTKRTVLKALATRVRPVTGRIVIREHVGATEELLADLWNRLAALEPAQTWLGSVDERTAAAFLDLLPRVQEYMKEAGGSYADTDTLIADLNSAGLRVEDMVRCAPDYGIVVSCVLD